MQIYSFQTFNLSKVLLTAEEVGQPYQLNLLDLLKGEHKSDAHLAKHPLGKVPVVEIEGQNYFESNAICRFICERNDNKLYGKTIEQRAIINQWIDFSTMHIGRWLSVFFYENNIKPAFFNTEPDNKEIDEAQSFLSQQLPIVENQLVNNTWLAGSEYSLADIIAFCYFSTTEISGCSLDDYPNIQQWYAKVKQRPSFNRAMANVPDGDMLALFTLKQ